MDATQKWLVCVGGAVLGVLVSVELCLHNANRNDMAAMEQRLSARISGVAAPLRGRDNRLREVEIKAAVNEALARMAVERRHEPRQRRHQQRSSERRNTATD